MFDAVEYIYQYQVRKRILQIFLKTEKRGERCKIAVIRRLNYVEIHLANLCSVVAFWYTILVYDLRPDTNVDAILDCAKPNKIYE